MSKLRHFTIREANALLPSLEMRFTQLMQLRTQLRAAHAQLAEAGESPTAETLALTSGPPALVSARGRFRALVETFTESTQEIEELGVAVKDVDIGLCDFLGERDGRDVWLCWQLGEKKVSHWHELGSGFSSRQPLDEPEPRLLH